MEDKKQKILILDDDQLLLKIYTQKFAKSEFEVITSTKGEEVLEKLREGLEPDIFLLDVVMPSLDGFDLLEKIKEEKLAKKAVVIMLTNQGQKSDADRADKLGVSGYIVKANTTPSEVMLKISEIYKKHFKENKI